MQRDTPHSRPASNRTQRNATPDNNGNPHNAPHYHYITRTSSLGLHQALVLTFHHSLTLDQVHSLWSSTLQTLSFRPAMEPIAAPSAAPATAEEYIPPSPPPTPPCVSFTPPLFLQRRTTVHSVLRHISSSPRFSGKLRSVLDVGCGTDPLLLRSLIPCEDELPLERITGIDCDEEIFHPSVADSVAPGSFGGTGEAEDRWRRLDVSLLQG